MMIIDNDDDDDDDERFFFIVLDTTDMTSHVLAQIEDGRIGALTTN